MKPSAFARRAVTRAQANQARTAVHGAEERYVRDLRALLRGVHKAYMDFLLPRVKDIARRTDSRVEASSGLDILGVQVETSVRKHVGALFDRMSGTVNKANKRVQERVIGVVPDVRVAAQIAHARDANILLVENAARVYAQNVRDIFESPEAFDLTGEELKARLLERGDVSDSRAELIARDQCLKLNGALTQTRQENAGISSYTWSTSNDERVREEHRALEGQVFDWNSPPEVGHPGEDYQCRCVALPVIDEQEET